MHINTRSGATKEMPAALGSRAVSGPSIVVYYSKFARNRGNVLGILPSPCAHPLIRNRPASEARRSAATTPRLICLYHQRTVGPWPSRPRRQGSGKRNSAQGRRPRPKNAGSAGIPRARPCCRVHRLTFTGSSDSASQDSPRGRRRRRYPVLRPYARASNEKKSRMEI